MPSMIFRNVFVAGLSLAALVLAVGPTFIPDATFKGSSLNGWHTLGQVEWKAENGEITGTPKSPTGGWLLMDKGLQDLGVYASFRCSGGCKTGIILRAQKTADGMKGLLVSLSEGEQGLYRISMDAGGQETHRDKLRFAASMIRFGQPASAPVPPFVARMASRGPVYHAGEWNTVQAIVDADILRASINASGNGGQIGRASC